MANLVQFIMANLVQLDLEGNKISTSKKHQIEAGTVGRLKGHEFEKTIANSLNKLDAINYTFVSKNKKHVFRGNPAKILLQYIVNNLKIKRISEFKALWIGGLATAKAGDAITINGKKLKGSKSDVLIQLSTENFKSKSIGVSIKDCNTRSPTNDQIFFTTATAFCNLLRKNDIKVSPLAEKGLKAFCGDSGFRPKDLLNEGELKLRNSTPERFFFEEINDNAKKELIEIFSENRKKITEIMFRSAYKEDPFRPDFILHKTTKSDNVNACEVAVHSVEELIELSLKFSPFILRPYKIRKGEWKSDPKEHLAPQLGFIQMQRKGSKKNATQLQFNLKAGYFNQK